MSNPEQKFIIEGIHAGAQVNNAIADAITLKAQKMLAESLQENFEVSLQAKLSQMVNETLALHADATTKFAQQFLSQSKTKIAQGMIDTQHTYNQVAIAGFDISRLNEFDTDLKSEVQRLADESGTITIEADAHSSVGF